MTLKMYPAMPQTHPKQVQEVLLVLLAHQLGSPPVGLQVGLVHQRLQQTTARICQ